MRALLDVNVLIALLDADHSLHGRATSWFARHAQSGWASCPITENGCLRIMAHPSYPNALPVHAVAERLAAACSTSLHKFWTADISLLDRQIIDHSRIHGPRQLTDLYLLALAIRNGGTFVTFDANIPVDSIRGGDPRRLLVL